MSIHSVPLQSPAGGDSLLCRYAWLGRVDYDAAWRLQKELSLERSLGLIPDTLLLLEHPPVYTTGRRRGADGNLRLPRERLGAPLLEVDRGGHVTFHGPGQLVAYPVIELRGLGVVDYVRKLEEVIIRTLAGYGVGAGRERGLTGVWVDRDKIAAIGVRVSRPGGPSGGWVTGHGLALNVDVDLGWFERIVPCGIVDRGVTSLQRLVGDSPSLTEVAERLAGHFGSVFGRQLVPASGDRLHAPAAPAGGA